MNAFSKTPDRAGYERLVLAFEGAKVGGGASGLPEGVRGGVEVNVVDGLLSLHRAEPPAFLFESMGHEADDPQTSERLHEAIAQADRPEAERLLAAGASLTAYDYLSRTPLHVAAEEGHEDLVRWLITLGAGIDAHDEANIGETPLCLAVKAERVGVVELLLEAGANPDIPGWAGLTARDRARRMGERKGAELSALIERHRPT